MNYIKIAKQAIKIEIDELTKLLNSLDKNFTKAIKLILKTKGKVVIFGVGKSGLIGAKIAATLSSTGTSAITIHPTEAMHGDFGMISKNDSDQA